MKLKTHIGLWITILLSPIGIMGKKDSLSAQEQNAEDALLQALIFATAPQIIKKVRTFSTPQQIQILRKIEKNYIQPGKPIPKKELQRIRQILGLPHTTQLRELLTHLQPLLNPQNDLFFYEETYAHCPLTNKKELWVILNTKLTPQSWIETEAWEIADTCEGASFTNQERKIPFKQACFYVRISHPNPDQLVFLKKYLQLRDKKQLSEQKGTQLLNQAGIPPHLHEKFAEKNIVTYNAKSDTIKVQMQYEYTETGFTIPHKRMVFVIPQHAKSRPQELEEPTHVLFEDLYRQNEVSLGLRRFVQYQKKKKRYITYYRKGKVYYKKVHNQSKAKEITKDQFEAQSQKKSVILLVYFSKATPMEEILEADESFLSFLPFPKGNLLLIPITILSVLLNALLAYQWWKISRNLSEEEDGLKYQNYEEENTIKRLKKQLDRLNALFKKIPEKNRNPYVPQKVWEKAQETDDERDEIRPYKYKGLPNIGNTCYLNADLQGFFPLLKEELKKEETINTFTKAIRDNLVTNNSKLNNTNNELESKVLNLLEEIKQLGHSNNTSSEVIEKLNNLRKILSPKIATKDINHIDHMIGFFIKKRLRRIISYQEGNPTLKVPPLIRELVDLVNITMLHETDRFTIGRQYDAHEFMNKLFDLCNFQKASSEYKTRIFHNMREDFLLFQEGNSEEKDIEIKFKEREKNDQYHSFLKVNLETAKKDQTLQELVNNSTLFAPDADYRLSVEKVFSEYKKGLEEKDYKKAKEALKKYQEAKNDDNLNSAAGALIQLGFGSEEKKEIIKELVKQQKIKYLSDNEEIILYHNHEKINDRYDYYHEPEQKFLLIQFLRYKILWEKGKKNGYTNKITTLIYPDEEIKLLSHKRNEEYTYKLVGVVMHHGSTPTGGHYTAYALKSDEWYHFNDSHVRKVGKAGKYNELKTNIQSNVSSWWASHVYLALYKQVGELKREEKKRRRKKKAKRRVRSKSLPRAGEKKERKKNETTSSDKEKPDDERGYLSESRRGTKKSGKSSTKRSRSLSN